MYEGKGSILQGGVSRITSFSTYQTVKLPLEVWNLVKQTMDARDIDFSEALSLLIRHGFIRLSKEEWQQSLQQ